MCGPLYTRVLKNRNMKRIYFISFFIIPFFALSQKPVDKSSIYENVKQFEEKKLQDLLDSGFAYRDIYLFEELNQYLNFLETKGIDTLGVYLEYFSNPWNFDTCVCCDKEWVAYIHWTKNGQIFHKHLHSLHKWIEKNNYCNFDSIEIENSVLIDYYSKWKKKIKNEIIMPVTRIELNDSLNEYEYFFSAIDHTPEYTLYCKLGNDWHYFDFDLYQLETKDNLFYEENNSLISISWWKLVENQINKIENKF